jgi:hypothetical protein
MVVQKASWYTKVQSAAVPFVAVVVDDDEWKRRRED